MTRTGGYRPGSVIGWTMRHVLLIGALTLAGNWVDYKISPWAALPGLLILLAMVMVGLVLTRLIPLFR
jgi:hypothetical protein